MACLLCLWSDQSSNQGLLYKKTEPLKRRKEGSPKPKSQANMLTFSSAETPFRSVLFTPEVNLTLLVSDWWIDIGANIHICSDQSLFSAYQVSSRGTVTMENNVVALVLRIGQINLKLTSEKILALQDVHQVSEIRRNLISRSLLVQQDYKLVFESNKVVITKGLNFIGKIFLCDVLFKLNVKISTFTSPTTLNVEPSVTWHQHLGYVNYNSIKRMLHLNLIFQAKHQIQ